MLPKGSKQNGSTSEPISAGRARFREYSRIQLPFLRYSAKLTASGYKPNLYSLANLFDSRPKNPKSELARSLGSIPDELRHIAHAFDSPDQQSADVICGDLSIQSARNKRGFELVLGIENPERFREEGDVFNKRLKLRSNAEPQTHLNPEREFAIPLAWFDISVSEQDRSKYLEGIGPGVVSGTPVELGPISWYVKPTSEPL
jgi:hypothetical protein